MAETQNQTPELVESEVEKTSRFKTFVANHPRAARVAGITAAATAVVGAVVVAKSRKQDADSTLVDASDSFDLSSPETAQVTEA